VLFLVSPRPANELHGTGHKEGVKGLSVGAVELFGVGGLGCLLIVVYVHKDAREPLAN